MHFNVKFMPNKKDYCFKGKESKQRFTFELCVGYSLHYKNKDRVVYIRQLRNNEPTRFTWFGALLDSFHFMLTYE